VASETLELILRARDLASGAVANLRQGMERLHEGSRQYNATLERLGATGNEFKNTMIKMAAVAGIGGVASSFIEIASSAEKTKLMLAGLMGSTEKATEAFDYLLEVSTKAPFSLTAMKDSFIKLQVAGLDPMHGSLETLMDAISAFGGSDQELQRAAIAMQQMAGKGVVSMEELRQQLGEALPTAMKAMAEGMGLSMAQLSKAVEQGNVSATQGLTAMMNKLQEWYGGTGVQMMDSWTGMISNLKVAWEKFVISLSETGVFDNLKGVISEVLAKIEEMKQTGELAEWGSRISTVISSTITIFTTLATVFGKVIDTLGPILPALIEMVLYLKSMQLVFGALVGLPMQLFANIVALSNGFKAFMGMGIIEMFGALRTAILAAAASSVILQVALGVGAVGAFLFALSQIAKLIEAIQYYRKSTAELQQAQADLAEQTAYTASRAEKYEKILRELGFSTMKEFNKAVKEGAVVFNEQTKEWEKASAAAGEVKKSYEELIRTVKFGSDEFMKMREMEAKTLKAQIDYEIAVQEQAYKEGKLSLEEFLNFKTRRTEDYTNRIIYLKNLEIEALKEDPEKNREKIFAAEEEIQQIKIASAQAQIKTQQDLTGALQKEYETDLTNWKSLEELRLQSLESQLNLQNAMEETAARQGLIIQSELLEAQLERFRQISQLKIDQKSDEILKLYELGKQETEDFRKAYADREQMQEALEAQTIQSEQQIAEQKKQEAIEAEAFIAELLQDSFRKDEARRQEQLKQLELFWQQGRISAEDYYDALEILDKQYTSEFKRDIEERTEQLNLAMDIILQRRQQLEQTIDGLMTDSFADIEHYFGNWKKALNTDIDDMQAEINQFMRHTTMVGADTFWQATLYGRRMIEMTGTTIYEWAQRVADYIAYVKQLMASLQDTITSYRMQLLQIRGDRLGELELWRKQEREKIEEQFKDLKGTKEYYDALALLDELYAEKKKKILDDIQQATEQSQQEQQGTGGTGGSRGSGAGTVGVAFPSLEEFRQKLQDNLTLDLGGLAMEMAGGGTQATEKKLKLELTIPPPPSLDPAMAERYVDNTLWPILKRKFALMGVNLS
jgi:tape measure domain-containing protein